MFAGKLFLSEKLFLIIIIPKCCSAVYKSEILFLVEEFSKRYCW